MALRSSKHRDIRRCPAGAQGRSTPIKPSTHTRPAASRPCLATGLRRHVPGGCEARAAGPSSRSGHAVAAKASRQGRSGPRLPRRLLRKRRPWIVSSLGKIRLLPGGREKGHGGDWGSRALPGSAAARWPPSAEVVVDERPGHRGVRSCGYRASRAPGGGARAASCGRIASDPA
jgi:hypothetical protein